MSQAFSTETIIKRPLDDVWDALTDWDRAPQWMTAVDSLRADGSVAPGTTLTFTSRGKARSSEITAVEPGRSVTLTSTQGGVVARFHYALEPTSDPERTQVRLTDEVDTRSGWKVVESVVRRAIRRTDGTLLDALRSLLEA